jgi:hypothetical protein
VTIVGLDGFPRAGEFDSDRFSAGGDLPEKVGDVLALSSSPVST